MKYIYFIAAALVAASAALWFFTADDRPARQKAALIINDRVVSEAEFEKLYASRLPYYKKRDEFIDGLITRELLIQEARKAGIDKEEAFRRSIKNFYEQSLTKVLLDRKFASLQLAVSDDEVSRYRSLLGKRLQFTLFSADNKERAQNGEFRHGEQTEGLFDDLSDEMKYPLFLLKEGERSTPFRMGDRYFAVKLDRVTESRRPVADLSDAGIKKILMEWKKEKVINDWIEGLREKASIKVLTTESGRG